MEPEPRRTTEIIAVGSGKGGTGKTLVSACLAYALTRIGLRTLLIDADTGTDGLSLFLLGTPGMRWIDEVDPQQTFGGILRRYGHSDADVSKLEFEPRQINRVEKDDRELSYRVLISSNEIYGDLPESDVGPAASPMSRDSFRRVVSALFDQLRERHDFDYVIVDTRGGFAFESTDVCALADSFIVVTEPDFTSFYQDRNLIRRINASAQDQNRKALLRSIIVNKATETAQQSGDLDLSQMEAGFRLALEREFPVRFDDTHPVPLEIEVVMAYKTHEIPFLRAPASYFSYALLSAFSDILRIVTQPWTREQIDGWNVLVQSVTDTIAESNGLARREEEELIRQADELTGLRTQSVDYQQRIESAERERDEVAARYERELRRTEDLIRPPERPAQEAARPQRSWMGSRVWLVAVAVITVVGLMVALGVLLASPDGETEEVPAAAAPAAPAAPLEPTPAAPAFFPAGVTPVVTFPPSDVTAGSEEEVFGRNLDSVSGVFLVDTDGSTVDMPYGLVSESRLILFVPDNVEPGEYLLVFDTESGVTIAAGSISVLPPVAPAPAQAAPAAPAPAAPAPAAPAPAPAPAGAVLPEITFLPSEVTVGSEQVVFGRNLDSVSAVFLVDGDGREIEYGIESETRLILFVDDNVEPGDYLLVFDTDSGVTIEVGSISVVPGG